MSDTAIPLKEIGSHPALTNDERITAVAIMLEETAVMQALVMIHGKEHGARKYIEYGGHIRFVADEPCLMWPKDGLTYPTFGVT